VQSPRSNKTGLSWELVKWWRSLDPPGRFLKKDEKTKLWNDIGDKKARRKTSQLLREYPRDARQLIGSADQSGDGTDTSEEDMEETPPPNAATKQRQAAVAQARPLRKQCNGFDNYRTKKPAPKSTMIKIKTLPVRKGCWVKKQITTTPSCKSPNDKRKGQITIRAHDASETASESFQKPAGAARRLKPPPQGATQVQRDTTDVPSLRNGEFDNGQADRIKMASASEAEAVGGHNDV
jgi:hypothetical protein